MASSAAARRPASTSDAPSAAYRRAAASATADRAPRMSTLGPLT